VGAERRLALAARGLVGLDPAAALDAGLSRAGARLGRSAARLEGMHPGRRLHDAGARLRALDWRSPGRARLARAGDGLAACRLHLEALDPVRVLERGYAIVRDERGHVVRDASGVAAGEAVAVQLSVGRLDARIEGVHHG
jgi:exodeoxyribonuclease VII large subunit